MMKHYAKAICTTVRIEGRIFIVKSNLAGVILMIYERTFYELGRPWERLYDKLYWHPLYDKRRKKLNAQVNINTLRHKIIEAAKLNYAGA